MLRGVMTVTFFQRNLPRMNLNKHAYVFGMYLELMSKAPSINLATWSVMAFLRAFDKGSAVADLAQRSLPGM